MYRYSNHIYRSYSTQRQFHLFTRQQSPEFLEYKRQRDALLAASPHLLRLDCMNPVQALKHTLRPSSSPSLQSTATSLDCQSLYRTWSLATRRQIPADKLCYGLGVRDALHGVFSLLPHVAPFLPSDVYPVYAQILASLGIAPRSAFPVVGFHLKSLLTAASAAQSPLILLPAPLSPVGRDLTLSELGMLLDWVQTPGTDRWLVFDSVYDYATSSSSSADSEDAQARDQLLQQLLATDRVFQLFSISKTWLSPLTLGFVHAPAPLRAALQPLLTSPDPARLQLAEQLISDQPSLPALLQRRFQAQWSLLAEHLAHFTRTSWVPPETGYFSIFPMPYPQLLSRGILAIPPSLFGSARSDVSYISCLHDIAPQDRGSNDDSLTLFNSYHASKPSSTSPASAFTVSKSSASKHTSKHTSNDDLYHLIPLSNFAKGFDKYSRRYSKEQAGLTSRARHPNSFFLLHRDELAIGFHKASELVNRFALAGDTPVVLTTSRSKLDATLLRQSAHHLGLKVLQPFIPVDSVALISQSQSHASESIFQLSPITVEEATARSLQLQDAHFKPYHALSPRSISLLPVATGCQAKCAFCFSHSSISHDQRQRSLSPSHIRTLLAAAKQRGAERAVITGGGEPGLLPPVKLLEMISLCAEHYPRRVTLITNGYFLSSLEEPERVQALRSLWDAGLSVLSVSRHGLDEENNAQIMKLRTRADELAHTVKNTSEHSLRLRWVCVLQRGGVQDVSTLEKYLDWVVSTGASEICFKELYVSTSHESVYHSSAYNQWSLENQVSLSLIHDFAHAHGFAQVDALPWGSPIFDGKWRDHPLKIAAYTEPSVFWERTYGLARSWNVLADGIVYASLEDKQSQLEINDEI